MPLPPKTTTTTATMPTMPTMPTPTTTPTTTPIQMLTLILMPRQTAAVLFSRPRLPSLSSATPNRPSRMVTSSSKRLTRATGGGGGLHSRSLTAWCRRTRSSISLSQSPIPTTTMPHSPLAARPRLVPTEKCSNTSPTTLTHLTSSRVIAQW